MSSVDGAASRLFHRVAPEIAVLFISSIIFLGTIISPPSLMDDVDAVQAQISREMIQSRDWVTARLDGVIYLEKAPLKYWLIAISFLIFGIHDWAARIPAALAAVLLCWLVLRIGEWAFGKRAGLNAGIVLATCIGMFLFSRILIPDTLLTLAVTTALFAMLRLMEGEPKQVRWSLLFWTSIASAVLLKGLIGLVFPIGISIVYLAATRQLLYRETFRRFRLLTGILLFLIIALPWHVLATIRNPPLFDLTMHSESGSYHGFFWFYFINEQLLRFLNRRYPRDYDTVPRALFWLLHLVWLFPWSLYLPAVFRLKFGRGDRAARVRVLALCWIGFVLLFFSLSTSQEYYSLPCYPAFALLIGSALASESRLVRIGSRLTACITAAALIAVLLLLYAVRNTPAPGDIASALSQHPEAYTLSLGHMGDLTIQAFAYLRLPLVLAAIALAIGAVALWLRSQTRVIWGLAIMMVIFFHAARFALVAFDPYLSSRPLAEALRAAPPGRLIVDNPYWEYSSIFFYANREGLMLNGRRNNLEYGSYAPGAADVFIDDGRLRALWQSADRWYVVTDVEKIPRLKALAGSAEVNTVNESGNKVLLSNQK